MSTRKRAFTGRKESVSLFGSTGGTRQRGCRPTTGPAARFTSHGHRQRHLGLVRGSGSEGCDVPAIGRALAICSVVVLEVTEGWVTAEGQYGPVVDTLLQLA